MGLGKTVECLALLLAKPLSAAAHSGKSWSKATLIVVPLTLLDQWEFEINKVVATGRLKYFVHHGESKTTPDQLAEYDVVLTTYDMLTAEGSKLKRKKATRKILKHIHWHRVVLDESQRIQNATNVISDTCCDLKRTNSWMMSGTPMGNLVADLVGQLRFLQVQPWCRIEKGWDRFWEREVTERWESGEEIEGALEIIHGVLTQIMIRHSKSQVVDGEKLLELPARHVSLETVEMVNQHEQYLYLYLEQKAQEVFMQHEARGQLQAHIVQIGALVRELGLACSHPTNVRLQVLGDRAAREQSVGGVEKQKTAHCDEILNQSQRYVNRKNERLDLTLGEMIRGQYPLCSICLEECKMPVLTRCACVLIALNTVDPD